MGQSDEAWGDVVEQVKKLGSLVAYSYRAQEGEGGTETASKDEVKDALVTLGESITAAFATVGDVIRNPEIQEEARQTAGAFFAALGRSFSELGDDISARRETDESPSDPTQRDAAAPDESEEDE